MKKAISIILSAVFLLLCGCSGILSEPEKDKNNSGAAEYPTINLAWNSADSLNPYTAQTELNRTLSVLLFDSLYKVNGDFEAVPLLAEKGVLSGNIFTVTLSLAYFSDGSRVTADDVVYSFNIAKQSNTRYAHILKSIKSANVAGEGLVNFTCEKIDPYVMNLLDFPVIKQGSDNKRNADNIIMPPIGSGRYVFDTENDILTANTARVSPIKKYKTIKLINAAGQEALSHVIDIGVIDVYYTSLDDCNILRMQGKRQNISLNNLVYIGFNMKSGICKNVNFRQAVSAAIDRAKICENAYFTNAAAASGIFHPNFPAISGIQSISETANLNIALENLSKMGYNDKNSKGIFIDSNGRELAVTLLCNKENQFRSGAAELIVKQLAAAGIKVIKEEVAFETYKQRLTAGQFQLYLAETNILNNMDVSALLCPGGALAYGLPLPDNKTEQPVITVPDTTDVPEEPQSTVTLSGVIEGFYKGKNTVADIASLAISDMAVAPICYRTGILFCSDKISNILGTYEGDIYAFLE